MKADDISRRCTAIADQVEPGYRNGPVRSCSGHYARRWQAAWDGACIALGSDPARYLAPLPPPPPA